MDASSDRVVFQTREWLDFLGATQGAEPVVAAVVDDGEDVGWFTGAITRRFGLRILGSPFPGWTTESMGFNLRDGVDRHAAAAALVRFAFRTLGCAHVELKDRRLEPDDPGALGYAAEPTLTFEMDIADGEAAILGRMSSACRRALRQGGEGRPHGRAGDRDGVRGRVLRPARRGLRPPVARPDVRRRAGPRADRPPRADRAAAPAPRAARRTGCRSRPGSSPRTTTRRTSGAARACASTRSTARTRPSSGTRSGTGGSAA